MKLYIFKRLLLIGPTVLGVAVLVFFLMRVIPGDICLARWVDYGMDLDPALLELCRNDLGLNAPLHVQFFIFIQGIVTFDLGHSMWTGRPVIEELALRFPLSLQLAIMATITSILIAIPLGIVSAVKQNTWLDYLVRIVSIAGNAIPSFWLGILIILGLLTFSQAWFGEPWMPPIEYVSPFVDPLENLAHLFWPMLATGYRYTAVVARMTRAAFLEILNEDFIRSAHAKGLPQKVVINRHALPNALLPIVSVITIQIGYKLGGSVITESVFALNGLGRLAYESILGADIPTVQMLVFFFALVFIILSILGDILNAWLDPRMRVE